MHKFRALAADCARQVRARFGANTLEASHVKRIELALHALRLSSIVDVNLSGFELALYSREETPFVYWYSASVLSMHAAVLRETLGHLRSDNTSPSTRALLLLLLFSDCLRPDDHSATEFASTELDFVAGLQAACLGSMLVSCLEAVSSCHR